MSRPRSELLEELVSELAPTRVARARWVVIGALALGWSLVIAATLTDGPLRPGAIDQLLGTPRFLLESTLGALTGLALLGVGVASGVPGRALGRSTLLAGGLAALWIGSYVLGLWFPTLEPSMLGKREGCALQTLFFGLPPLLVALGMTRPLASLHRVRTGALLGAAAGALPGLLMQLACMYDPAHILSHHIAPILGLIAAGAVLGPLALRRL